MTPLVPGALTNFSRTRYQDLNRYLIDEGLTPLSPDTGADNAGAQDEESPDSGHLELLQPLLLDSELQTSPH